MLAWIIDVFTNMHWGAVGQIIMIDILLGGDNAVMWIVDGRPQIMGLFNVSPKISLLGGVIGAFITYTVVKAMSDLGVAKAEITIVISQIAVAYIIELFGLFGSEKKDFSWIKLLGIAVAVTGVVIFSMCGNSKE